MGCVLILERQSKTIITCRVICGAILLCRMAWLVLCLITLSGMFLNSCTLCFVMFYVRCINNVGHVLVVVPLELNSILEEQNHHGLGPWKWKTDLPCKNFLSVFSFLISWTPFRNLYCFLYWSSLRCLIWTQYNLFNYISCFLLGTSCLEEINRDVFTTVDQCLNSQQKEVILASPCNMKTLARMYCWYEVEVVAHLLNIFFLFPCRSKINNLLPHAMDLFSILLFFFSIACSSYFFMGKEGRIWNPSPFMEPFSVSYFIYDFQRASCIS